MCRGIEKWLEVCRKMDSWVGVGRRGRMRRELEVMEMDSTRTLRVPTVEAVFCLAVIGGGSSVMNG